MRSERVTPDGVRSWPCGAPAQASLPDAQMRRGITRIAFTPCHHDRGCCAVRSYVYDVGHDLHTERTHLMTARLPQVHSIGPATDEKNKTIPGHIDVRIVHAGLKDSPIETHRINVTDASRFLADLANAIVTVTR